LSVDDRRDRIRPLRVANKLALTNADERPQRLRLQPFSFADIGPGFRRHDYDMPPGARCWIAPPTPDVELEIEVGFNYIVVLVTGCGVEDIKVVDRTTSEPGRSRTALMPLTQSSSTA